MPAPYLKNRAAKINLKCEEIKTAVSRDALEGGAILRLNAFSNAIIIK